ncbi:ORF6N domain-containing protein [Flavobacterium sp.]|uniref:ORF6N domain-containing protein n=1 Tax=Flavobacterium sp. TaxID=239 RepID=UPI00286DEFAE|nr:ORF6N domain-containing protein [Flavobacterium sp.]
MNEQVKRNILKFPDHFMFQLDKYEFEILKSQIATSSWGGSRKLPYAFTEHGVLQLSNVLKSERATQMSIKLLKFLLV